MSKKVEDRKNQRGYKLGPEDVGKIIAFVFTPFNLQGRPGESVTRQSAPIRGGEPRVVNVVVVPAHVGGDIVYEYVFTGGLEGRSECKWQGSEDGGTTFADIATTFNNQGLPASSTANLNAPGMDVEGGRRGKCSFPVTPDLLGLTVRCLLTPVSSDGAKGPQHLLPAVVPELLQEWGRTIKERVKEGKQKLEATIEGHGEGKLKLDNEGYTLKTNNKLAKSNWGDQASLKCVGIRDEFACEFTANNKTWKLRFHSHDARMEGMLTFWAYKGMAMDVCCTQLLNANVFELWRKGKINKKSAKMQQILHEAFDTPQPYPSGHAAPAPILSTVLGLRGKYGFDAPRCYYALHAMKRHVHLRTA